MSGGSRLRWIAVASILLAATLRLPGVFYGLPDLDHPYSHHPDEFNTIRALAHMRPAEGDFNPRYFHNPALFYYLCGATFLTARGLGLLPPLARESFHSDPRLSRRLYLLGRLLSLAAGALTAGIVALSLGHRLGGLAALLGGLSIALSPAHLVLSGWMDVDVLLTLFAALGLEAAWRLLERGERRWALIGGAIVGLACATKYSGVLLLPPVLAGALLGPGRRPARLLLVLASAAAGFLLASPYSLLDSTGFAEGLRYVMQERVAGRWSALGHGWGFPLRFLWPWLVGEVGMFLGLAAFVLALVQGLRAAVPPALLVAGVYLAVAASGTDYVRYSLPALPALVWALALIAARIGKSAAAGRIGLVVLVVGNQALRAVALLGLLTGPDPRVEASRALSERYPSGARLLVPRQPYYFSPRVLFAEHFRSGSRRGSADPARFSVLDAGWDPEALADPGLAAVVLSEAELLYPAETNSGTGRFLARLLNTGEFHEVLRFDRPARLGPLLLETPLPQRGFLYRPDSAARLRDRRLPHDLKYLNPAVLVFERARSAPATASPLPDRAPEAAATPPGGR